MPDEDSPTGSHAATSTRIATSTSSNSSASGNDCLLDSGAVCDKSGVIVELPLTHDLDEGPMDDSGCTTLVPDQSSQLTDSLDIDKADVIAYEDASEGEYPQFPQISFPPFPQDTQQAGDDDFG